MQTVQTGVLVIGGGGAASRAALEAQRAGADVMLATKGAFGAIGTRGAGATASGFSAVGVFATPGWTGKKAPVEIQNAQMVMAPPERALTNILQSGLGMADPKLARIMVQDGIANRTALLELGATFGESGLRSHGVPIMAALVNHIRRSNIKVQERTMIVGLLVQDGECRGAIGVDELNGETILIKAGATVIATGGDSNLFMLNLNPSCNTGDGYSQGYEAGAELMNLEFKQIFLGTVFPTRNMITRVLPPYTKLTNANHEEFLRNYLPAGASPEEALAQRNGHNPFSTRDSLSKYVDIGIIGEVKAGRGTSHNGIYLDRSDPRIPPIAGANEYWLYKGIDYTRPVEVGICHHCSLGGFRIDENAETTVPHLFAAGEAAAGPHGADRMGGHMLLASQVFGARAGKNAAAYAKRQKVADVDNRISGPVEERIEILKKSHSDHSPAEIKKQLQQSAYFNLLTIKSRESLIRFLNEVKNIRQDSLPRLSVKTSQDLIDALELQSLLTLAEIEANVSLERTESRGPHYRTDFPTQDDKNWLKSITVKKVDDKCRLDTVALDPAWQSAGDEKIGYWG